MLKSLSVRMTWTVLRTEWFGQEINLASLHLVSMMISGVFLEVYILDNRINFHARKARMLRINKARANEINWD